ncbi:MAG TPA: SDR family oxidoreductase [Candidatus Limnocylindrales bacterium]
MTGVGPGGPDAPGGRFAGRAVLVAGSTGMAAAAARAIAAEGGAVFVVSRTAEHCIDLATLIRADGGRADAFAADLADEAAVDEAFAAFRERFDRLDGVFAAAGISGRRFGDAPLHEATLDGWETVLASNARSTFLVCRAAVRTMLDQEPGTGGRGAIVTMSSRLATHPAAEHFATHAYAASKGAIESFSRAVAAYYAPDGIRVNVLAPGLVATPMSRRAQADEAVLRYLAAKQPLAGGPIETDDTTGTVLFLLGDESRMITGQVVAVDAGWSVSEPSAS